MGTKKILQLPAIFMILYFCVQRNICYYNVVFCVKLKKNKIMGFGCQPRRRPKKTAGLIEQET